MRMGVRKSRKYFRGADGRILRLIIIIVCLALFVLSAGAPGGLGGVGMNGMEDASEGSWPVMFRMSDLSKGEGSLNFYCPNDWIPSSIP